MSYRRRNGRRWKARQKVTRAEMVKFYQVAGQKERLAIAQRQAEQVAKWLRRGLWALAVVAVAVAAWIRSRL